jgi:hypothetical protein
MLKFDVIQIVAYQGYRGDGRTEPRIDAGDRVRGEL